MPRRLFKLVLFLLLGAIVNVAVAMGCARWSKLAARQSWLNSQADVPANWAAALDSPPSAQGWLYQGWGYDMLTLYADTRGGRLFDVWRMRVSDGWKGGPPDVAMTFVGDAAGTAHRLVATRSGWPLRAFEGELENAGIPMTALDALFDEHRQGRRAALAFADAGMRRPRIRLLPYRPLWPGVAVNTVVYAALLWVLPAATGFMRRRVRIRRGLCPTCGYPIGMSDVCTECGGPVIRDATRRGPAPA